MASRDTPRGVSPVLRGVCANLLWKRSKAVLSYSTSFTGSEVTPPAVDETASAQSDAAKTRSKV